MACLRGKAVGSGGGCSRLRWSGLGRAAVREPVFDGVSRRFAVQEQSCIDTSLGPAAVSPSLTRNPVGSWRQCSRLRLFSLSPAAVREPVFDVASRHVGVRGRSSLVRPRGPAYDEKNLDP